MAENVEQIRGHITDVYRFAERCVAIAKLKETLPQTDRIAKQQIRNTHVVQLCNALIFVGLVLAEKFVVICVRRNAGSRKKHLNVFGEVLQIIAFFC